LFVFVLAAFSALFALIRAESCEMKAVLIVFAFVEFSASLAAIRAES
jgi:hypothetical protein